MSDIDDHMVTLTNEAITTSSIPTVQLFKKRIGTKSEVAVLSAGSSYAPRVMILADEKEARSTAELSTEDVHTSGGKEVTVLTDGGLQKPI